MIKATDRPIRKRRGVATKALIGAALAGGLLTSGAASAALIGVVPEVPLISYDNTGTTTYTPVSASISAMRRLMRG